MLRSPIKYNNPYVSLLPKRSTNCASRCKDKRVNHKNNSRNEKKDDGSQQTSKDTANEKKEVKDHGNGILDVP
jgi:hypothetical protein